MDRIQPARVHPIAGNAVDDIFVFVRSIVGVKRLPTSSRQPCRHEEKRQRHDCGRERPKQGSHDRAPQQHQGDGRRKRRGRQFVDGGEDGKEAGAREIDRSQRAVGQDAARRVKGRQHGQAGNRVIIQRDGKRGEKRGEGERSHDQQPSEIARGIALDQPHHHQQTGQQRNHVDQEQDQAHGPSHLRRARHSDQPVTARTTQ